MNVRTALIAGLVALVSFAVYAESSVVTISDPRFVIPSAISLERHGDLDLDEYRAWIYGENLLSYREVNGHTHNYFPYGTTLMITPVIWLTDIATGRDLEARAQRGSLPQLEKTLAAAIVAIAAALMFLIALEVLGSVGLALAAAAVLAFGTSTWSVASRALWMHGPMMVLLGLTVLLALHSSRRPILAGLMALPLGFGFVVRPTAAAAIVCFGVWVAWQRRRQLPLFVGIGAVIGAAFFLANKRIFGDWLPEYYQAGHFGEGNKFFEAFAGNLVSPARGLLVFSPVLLLVFLRRRKLTPLEWAAAGTIVVHLVLISRFFHWWGGYSFGPRLFSDIAPLAVFLMLPVLKDLRKPVIGGAFAVLLAASMFIHWRGATVYETWLWNAVPNSVDTNPTRLWDWGDLMFLRSW